MNLLYHEVTDSILGCGVTVHKTVGPGLPERSYDTALALEMEARGLKYQRQPRLTALYRDVVIGEYRPDFIVEECVVVEVKSVTKLEPVFASQVLTYLRVSGLKVGLLINFNVPSLNHGIRRFVL